MFADFGLDQLVPLPSVHLTHQATSSENQIRPLARGHLNARGTIVSTPETAKTVTQQRAPGHVSVALIIILTKRKFCANWSVFPKQNRRLGD